MRAPSAADVARLPRAATAVAAGGAALVVLVGRTGSTAGQVGRVAAVVAAVVVTTLVLRRDRDPAAVVGGAAGVALTAAGLGIAGPHLAKGGGVVPTAAGLVCLIAGLVLLGTSARGAARALPHGGRTAVALGGVPLLAVLWAATVAVAATNVPPTDLDDRTPGDLGLAYEEVAVPAAGGVVLSGWYLPSRSGAAVVLRHGSGSTRSATLDHAAVLARRGYGVLLLDARGHGRSGGVAMDLGWWGDADIRAAVDHLAARPDVEPGRIGAVGLSMGGEEAVGALAAEPRLAAVVAEGATGRVSSDAAWLADAHGWRGVVQRGIDRLRDAVASVLTSAPRPRSLRDAVRAADDRAALLVAAGGVEDEVEVARDLDRTSPGVVDVWVVPGAGHTEGLATDPPGWERRVVGFLDEHLGGGPPGDG